MFAKAFLLRAIGLLTCLALSSASWGRPAFAADNQIVVEPTSGLVTSEDGASAVFTIMLTSQPLAAVQIDLSSSDGTEGTVSPSQVTLTPGNWSTPQDVTVTGASDSEADGDIPYTIVTAPAFSSDPTYLGQNPSDVSVTNLDSSQASSGPQANPESAITEEDHAVTIDVLANDTGLESPPLVVTIVILPQHGTAVVTVDNQVTYTPETNFNGEDRFTYQVCDSQAMCDQAEVTVIVEAVNDAPTPQDDLANTIFDTEVTINVLANDSDIDGDVLLLELFDEVTANGGTVVRADNGTPGDLSDDQLIYRPPAGFDGSDTFSYTVSDGSASVSAIVTVIVGSGEPGPVANDDSYSTNQNRRLDRPPPGVLGNDLDPRGAGLTALLVSNPSHGSLDLNADGSFTYIPESNFVGDDAFDYKANDGQADSNVATVTISVNSVNYAPVAADDSYSVGQTEQLSVNPPGVLMNDGDANGDPIEASVSEQPAYGSLDLKPDGSFRYDPNNGFVGIDSFVYKVSDGSMESNVAIVEIEVIDQIIPSESWQSPVTDGGVYDVGFETVLLKVSASDNVRISKVRFFRWDAIHEQFVQIAWVNSSPFQVELNTATLNPEWNQVFATAYDPQGNRSESKFIWLFRSGALLFLPLAHR